MPAGRRSAGTPDRAHCRTCTEPIPIDAARTQADRLEHVPNVQARRSLARLPFAAIRANPSSSATCHSTSTSEGGMPPSSSGRGASRVHRMTLSSSGHPDATPIVYGSEPKIADAPRTIPNGAANAAVVSEPARNDRRWIDNPLMTACPRHPSWCIRLRHGRTFAWI